MVQDRLTVDQILALLEQIPYSQPDQTEDEQAAYNRIFNRVRNFAHPGCPVIVWVPDDVQTLRPEWSVEKCAAWLADNGRGLTDRSIEEGWSIMGILLDMSDE